MLDEILDEIKTDEQIWNEAKEEWVGILSRLWVAYDKPLDMERLTIYRNVLRNIPLGLLDLAVNRAIQDHKFNSVPIVKDVLEAVRKILHYPQDLDQAVETWKASIPMGLYRFETGKWE